MLAMVSSDWRMVHRHRFHNEINRGGGDGTRVPRALTGSGRVDESMQ
jgi:hypothetical protein